MASSSSENPDENSRKKQKISHDTAEDLSAQVRINSLKDFELKHILNVLTKSKSVFLEGSFGHTDDSAVVLIDKLPISRDAIESLLSNADLALNLKAKSAQDPRISDYAFYPTAVKGDMKATVIYPATSKHIEKYKFQPSFHVKETPAVFKDIVLPHLQAQKFSLEWVYNILEHRSEQERVILEDSDPETGFVLLPDLKWDGSEADTLHIIAISMDRSIRSLRDLTGDKLTLLTNIRDKSLAEIQTRYHLPPEQIRSFIHYQPSYYHLHVHFTSVKQSAPGIHLEKAHLLNKVISNLQMKPDYYQHATLSYLLPENDPLLKAIQEQAEQ